MPVHSFRQTCCHCHLLPCRLVVSPLCAMLSSPDAAVAAAACADALTALLAATRSGLVLALHILATECNQHVAEVAGHGWRAKGAPFSNCSINSIWSSTTQSGRRWQPSKPRPDQRCGVSISSTC